MTPQPRMSEEAPYRWVGVVVLMPQDIKGLLEALPKPSNLSAQLQDAAHAAAILAMRLNEIEEGKAA